MLRTSVLLQLLVALCLMAAAGFAYQRGEPHLDRMRERWSALPEADKQRLQENWKRFQELNLEERRILTEKASAFQRMRDRIEANLTPEQRTRWAGFPEERKRELMREMLQSIGSRMREKLPAEIVERMRNASPEQRRQILAEAKKSLIENLVRERGLPEGLSAERWAQMQAMQPEAFLEAVREQFRSRMERQRAEGRPESRREGFERGPGMRNPRHDHRWPERKSPEPGRRLEGQDGAPWSEEQHQHMHRIRDAWYPRPGDIIDFADLDPKTRAGAVRQRVGARVLQRLLDEGLIDASEAARLNALAPEELERELRQRMPGGPERRGPGRRGGDER